MIPCVDILLELVRLTKSFGGEAFGAEQTEKGPESRRLNW